MAFTKKTWVDRVSQYPNRRTLTDVSTNAQQTVTVARNEGTITTVGDIFNATNMNDLENRINNEFNNHESNYEKMFPDYTTTISMNIPVEIVGGTNYTWTAPKNGWILVVADRRNASGNTVQVWINGVIAWFSAAYQAYYNDSCFLPVLKNDAIVIKTDASSGTKTWYIRDAKFFPCRGAQ